MVFFKIGNNANLKQPSSLSVSLQDIDSAETGRNQSGKLMRDRVVGGANAKRKVNCTWSGLTQNEISDLLQAMSGVKFKLYYPDPYEGSFESDRYFYVGDRTAPVYKNGANSNDKIIWESLSANFVEL